MRCLGQLLAAGSEGDGVKGQLVRGIPDLSLTAPIGYEEMLRIDPG